MKCDPEIFIIAAEEGVAVTVLQINGDAVPYTRAVGMQDSDGVGGFGGSRRPGEQHLGMAVGEIG